MKVERKYSPWAGNYLVSHPESFIKYCYEENSMEIRRRSWLKVANAAETSSNVKIIGLKNTEGMKDWC